MRAMGMTFGNSDDKTYFNFFAPGNRYNITRFQRAYTWGEYQIKGILDDLEYIAKTDKQVGWPSILIQESQTKDTNPNVTAYDLGDGQQRVVSVSLGLIAIWQRAYTLKSMGLISSEDFDYFRTIIPEVGAQRDADSLLTRLQASERGFQKDPTIRFFSNSANRTYRELLSPLTEDFWDTLEGSISEASDGSGLLRAFKVYYEGFSDLSFEDLRDTAEKLLTRITLSVLIYEPDEDMQRAFANMNSFGVALTEPELIKAEIYGKVKKKNPALAEEIALYWTNHFETEEWSNTGIRKELNPWKTAVKKSPLEVFLEEFMHMKDNWSIHLTGRAVSEKAHWLRDEWGRILDNTNDLESLWKDFKSSASVFQIARSNKAMTPGSLDWDINYSYQTLLKTRNIASILMKLKLAMDEDDLKKTLRLMMRYWMYLHFTGGDSRNMYHSLVLPNAFILNSKISYADIEKQLETTTGFRRQWRPKSYIVDVLSKREFENMNTDLCELFIFILNEEKRDRGEISGLFNTRTEIEGRAKSLEHILPQTSREDLSTEEQVLHKAFSQRLGNFLVLSTDLNSSASNRSVEEKIPSYEDAKWNPWGFFWIDGFLKSYRESGKWEFEEIEKRSLFLANLIAERLAPKNPYSEFKVLLDENSAGDTFLILEDENETDLTLRSDGTLEFRSGYRVGTLRDLRPLISSIENRRVINLARINENIEIVKQYSMSLGKDLAPVEHSKETIARSEVSVTSFGLQMTGFSLREIYNSFMRHYWVDNKAVMLELFKGTTGIVKNSLVSEERLRLHTILDAEYSIYSNKNRPSLAKEIELLCKTLNETCKITGVNDYINPDKKI